MRTRAYTVVKALIPTTMWAASVLVAVTVVGQDDIRAEKDVVEIPSSSNSLGWIIAIVVIGLLGWWLYRWLNRQKSGPVTQAADYALERLSKAKPLINEPSPEPIALEVTSLVREYIENRFSISALSQTTEEFLHRAHDHPEPELRPHQDELGQFLSACDRVKFARESMQAQDREELIETARYFINQTRSSEGTPTASVT